MSINNQCYLQVSTLFKKEKAGREDLDLKTSVVGPDPDLFDQVGSGSVIIVSDPDPNLNQDLTYSTVTFVEYFCELFFIMVQIVFGNIHISIENLKNA